MGVVGVRMIAEQAGTSAGEWLTGGATVLLAAVTAALVIVGYRQIRSLRDESRRQRTIDLYALYESESFVEPRVAVRQAFQIVERHGCGLTDALQRLPPTERTHFSRFCNFMEEAAQQYFAGLLDRRVAEDGLAYIAWFWWPRWRDYAYAQRIEQGTRRVFENWEDLYRKLDPIFKPISQHDANQLVEVWLEALGGSRLGLRRRLERMVVKSDRFRVGPHLDPQLWPDAAKEIASQHDVLREFFTADLVDITPPGQTEYVLRVRQVPPNGNASCRVLAVELRPFAKSRRRHESVRYVVTGLAWFGTLDEAQARIGPPVL